MSERSLELLFLGRVRFRAQRTPFGIRREDRFRHVHVIGKTGTGKTTLLEQLIRQDLRSAAGVAVFDPHGDLVERLAGDLPGERASHVVYLDLPDPRQPHGYNPLRHVVAERRPLVASGLMEALKKSWDARAWGARMENVLRHLLLAVLDYPDVNLPDLLRFLADARFRAAVLAHTSNREVLRYWREEYERYPPRLRAEAIAPIQARIGAFLADPVLAAVLDGSKPALSLRRILDEGQVLLVNLSRGRLGQDSAGLLGSLLLTSLALAAFSRADQPPEVHRDFFVYLDEFQSFTTRAIAEMVAELRKYRVGLVFAHQYLSQLEGAVQDAVLGNTGTLIAFRTGAGDAMPVARELGPPLDPADLMTLPNHAVYVRLLVDGAPTRAFSATTFGPDELPGEALKRPKN